MTCTYDKGTYLPRTCANGFVSDAFTNWNDPANAIVVPQVTHELDFEDYDRAFGLMRSGEAAKIVLKL
jgi:hypothetical protein